MTNIYSKYIYFHFVLKHWDNDNDFVNELLSLGPEDPEYQVSGDVGPELGQHQHKLVHSVDKVKLHPVGEDRLGRGVVGDRGGGAEQLRAQPHDLHGRAVQQTGDEAPGVLHKCILLDGNKFFLYEIE